MGEWSFQKVVGWLLVLAFLILIVIFILIRTRIIKESISKILSFGG